MAIHIILRPHAEYVAERDAARAAARAARRWWRPATWSFEAKASTAFLGLTLGVPSALAAIMTIAQ